MRCLAVRLDLGIARAVGLHRTALRRPTIPVASFPTWPANDEDWIDLFWPNGV